MRLSLSKLSALLFSVMTTGIAIFFLMNLARWEESWNNVERTVDSKAIKVAHSSSPSENAPPVSQNVVLYGFDEIFVNILTDNPSEIHTLSVRLELELFGEYSKDSIEDRAAGVKDTIITFTQDQDFDNLSTLAGKLHYKERLIGEINRFLGEAIVRDIHFSSFFLH